MREAVIITLPLCIKLKAELGLSTDEPDTVQFSLMNAEPSVTV